MHVNLVTAVAILTVATACNKAQPRMSPIEMDRLRKAAPGITDDCARRVEVGGIEALPNETEQCFEMLAEQRWRGLWRNDFEGSLFCPAPAATCAYKGDGRDVWLTPKSLRGELGALYEIEFEGRHTKVRGNYGHLGMAAHEIVVDHPISIKLIRPAPPPPTKAELVTKWRRCEAAGTCIPSDEMRRLMNGSE
jgi:hypothetical protein